MPCHVAIVACTHVDYVVQYTNQHVAHLAAVADSTYLITVCVWVLLSQTANTKQPIGGKITDYIYSSCEILLCTRQLLSQY